MYTTFETTLFETCYIYQPAVDIIEIVTTLLTSPTRNYKIVNILQYRYLKLLRYHCLRYPISR